MYTHFAHSLLNSEIYLMYVPCTITINAFCELSNFFVNW